MVTSDSLNLIITTLKQEPNCVTHGGRDVEECLKTAIDFLDAGRDLQAGVYIGLACGMLSSFANTPTAVDIEARLLLAAGGRG